MTYNEYRLSRRQGETKMSFKAFQATLTSEEKHENLLGAISNLSGFYKVLEHDPAKSYKSRSRASFNADRLAGLYHKTLARGPR